MRKRHIILIAIMASAILILGNVGIFSVFSSDDEGVCEMLLSDGSMYYTNYKDTLYRYDNTLGKGKAVSKISIRDGSRVIENNGYIYYGNGSTIFRRSLSSGDTEKLVAGKNIGVYLIVADKLIYSVAYKDADGTFYSQFEYRMYDLMTGRDEVLFSRSETMWHFRDGQGNIVFADSNLKGDSGLYVIELDSGKQKKLTDERVSKGYLANGKFYYTSQPLNGLRSIDLNGKNIENIPLPGNGEGNFFIGEITGFGDSIYIAVHFHGKYQLVRIDIKTQDATILAEGYGSVWELCTDGKTLYAYNTKSPADRKGNITVISLE